MIAGKNQSKISAKDISCECKIRFVGKNVIQINGGITINVYVSVKNVMYVKKIWNPATCSCENGKYLASIMHDSTNKCDEIVER